MKENIFTKGGKALVSKVQCDGDLRQDIGQAVAALPTRKRFGVLVPRAVCEGWQATAQDWHRGGGTQTLNRVVALPGDRRDSRWRTTKAVIRSTREHRTSGPSLPPLV